MLRMSWAGLAERWTLFTGALLSVALGVALVQSSLLLLISAATLDPPPGSSAAERMTFSDNATAAVAVLGIVLGAATFLATFIISSTFAFTVSQRRRDLALLRLVGGSRRQVRRLLFGEAVLLGALGAAIGIPAGLGVMAVQSRLLGTLGFVPDGFTGEWRPWILGVSVGTGLGARGRRRPGRLPARRTDPAAGGVARDRRGRAGDDREPVDRRPAVPRRDARAGHRRAARRRGRRPGHRA